MEGLDFREGRGRASQLLFRLQGRDDGGGDPIFSITAGFANPYLSVVFLPRSPGIAFDVSMNDEPQLGFSYI